MNQANHLESLRYTMSQAHGNPHNIQSYIDAIESTKCIDLCPEQTQVLIIAILTTVHGMSLVDANAAFNFWETGGYAEKATRAQIAKINWLNYCGLGRWDIFEPRPGMSWEDRADFLYQEERAIAYRTEIRKSLEGRPMVGSTVPGRGRTATKLAKAGFEHIVSTGYGYMPDGGPSFWHVHGYTRTSAGRLQFTEWRFWYEEDGTIGGMMTENALNSKGEL
jgi:hypothetical protein